jgi:hypothetical protein
VTLRDAAKVLREWAAEARSIIWRKGIEPSRLARVREQIDRLDDQAAVRAHELELQAITSERNAAALESMDSADKLWREPRSFVDDATQPAGQVADDPTVPLDPPHRPRRH